MTASDRLVFPEGFLWGTATASYQIEGAVRADGRGVSIWDTFAHTPGAVFHGDTGDVACDHYRLFERDVALMADLGLRAYRFSIAWPRVQPDGKGPVNRAGLDFYRRLVASLRARGIEPAVTLYHWDLPQALQDDGGWSERQTAERFADYAAVVAEALAGEVTLWITLNEPWVSAFVGHEIGQHAPGVRDTAVALRAAHHLLLGHGKAVQALRAGLPAEAQVGVTLNLFPVHAASDSPQDEDAARLVDAYHNGWFLEPIFHRRYPKQLHDRFVELLGGPIGRDGDLEEIGAPVDFLGVNYYTTRQVAAAAQGAGTAPAPKGSRPYPAYLGAVERPFDDVARTTKGWAIQPDGLRELLVRLHGEHPGTPLYVTENGAAFADYADPEGRVHDPERVEFLRGHFEAAHAALSAGVDLRGYFVWSLIDNFEWADGYSQRFGVVYVDFKSQQRIPKTSATFLSEVARTNTLSVDVR
jgi:beta-glucosidase